jgi:hypothetical protein
MNLNDLAVKITKEEGKKISLPIGQVKEVMKITFKNLAKMTLAEVADLLKKYH